MELQKSNRTWKHLIPSWYLQLCCSSFCTSVETYFWLKRLCWRISLVKLSMMVLEGPWKCMYLPLIPDQSTCYCASKTNLNSDILVGHSNANRLESHFSLIKTCTFDDDYDNYRNISDRHRLRRPCSSWRLLWNDRKKIRRRQMSEFWIDLSCKN